MDRLKLLRTSAVLSLTISVCVAHSCRAQQPSDLKVELRPANGPSRYRVGEKISLQVEFSSSTPDRYLEPCAMFFTSHFGFPQCRFFNGWKLEIDPAEGWVDLAKEFPTGGVYGGPTFEVSSHDLTATPTKVPFNLTEFFRFDKAGIYKVRVVTKVGLDDETTKGNAGARSKTDEAHSVSVNPELTIEIVPPSPDWLANVIREGIAAYSVPMLNYTNPPSPEYLRNQAARDAFCKVGTPDAVRALVKLLAAGKDDVARCVERTASPDDAIAAMKQLMVAPDTAIDTAFFDTLVKLQSRELSRAIELPMKGREATTAQREILFASLKTKHGEALTTSLATVLRNPPQSPQNTYEPSYTMAFDTAVIQMAAANFARLSETTQQWLLKDGWDGIDSPLMLAAVRQSAQAGDEYGLLHWYDLDRPAAEAFARSELVQPVPRFSSYTIRLPEAAVSGAAQQQLAEHFVALGQWRDLSHAASLLHRYATASVLPTVLPFIDTHLTDWPCSVRAPALAYVLKVSPRDAEPLIVKGIEPPGRNSCPDGGIVTELAKLEPSPVLDRIASAQIDGHSEATRDALEAIRLAGEPAMKAAIFAWIERWMRENPSGIKAAAASDPATRYAEQQRRDTLTELVHTYTSAQSWIVTPQDAAKLQELIGKDQIAALSCNFSCGSPITAGPDPGHFSINGIHPFPIWPNPEDNEYLNTTERLTYQVNQYGCRTMRDLKQKLLEFPHNSDYDFAWNFDERDQKEIMEITTFLNSYGAHVRNAHQWSFLPADPPR